MPASTRLTPAEDRALTRAFALARRGPSGTRNPQVGCVILSQDGEPMGEGYHRGCGTPHAEVAALAAIRRSAGADPARSAAGATAVVSLEPCRHHGSTGPCVDALIEAGVRRVVFAHPDPSTVAGGGAAVLAAQGIDVVGPVREAEGAEAARVWLTAEKATRPYVIAKLATSLDGRTAAADRTSMWITGPQARAHAHVVRSQAGAIIAGIQTVLTDDPLLTARPDVATVVDSAAYLEDATAGEWRERVDRAAVADSRPDVAASTAFGPQPMRVIMGRRPIPAEARVRGAGGVLLPVESHDSREVLARLWQLGVRTAVVEGGASITGAFFAAGLIDEIHAYFAPTVLGETLGALAGWSVPTIGDAPRWTTRAVERLGDDVLIVARRGWGQE